MASSANRCRFLHYENHILTVNHALKPLTGLVVSVVSARTGVDVVPPIRKVPVRSRSDSSDQWCTVLAARERLNSPARKCCDTTNTTPTLLSVLPGYQNPCGIRLPGRTSV